MINDDKDMVKLLLGKEGYNLTEKNSDGYTLLMFALNELYLHEEIIESLINGSNLSEIYEDNGDTLVMRSIRKDIDIDNFKKLLNGCDIKHKNINMETAIMVAIESRHRFLYDIINLLINKEKEYDIYNGITNTHQTNIYDNEETLLERAISKGCRYNIIKSIYDNYTGYDYNNILNALCRACEKSNYYIVKLLLTSKLIINTPAIAIALNYTTDNKIFKLLLETIDFSKNYNINHFDTAIHTLRAKDNYYFESMSHLILNIKNNPSNKNNLIAEYFLEE